MRHRSVRIAALAALFLPACAPAAPGPSTPTPERGSPQQAAYAPDALTARDYARAERFLSGGVRDLVRGEVERVHWLGDGRFWYRTLTPEGPVLVVVDPESRQRERLDPASERARSLIGMDEERPGADVVVSPDGRLGAFIREHDLWVRDLESGEEHRLTKDGRE
ncbi:MAG: hypothetical protein GWM90_04090, partial [Gemmatimonadetes bacterium]|nr:hypothetical protein [Gemmatimonadota bacterium]NIQ52844.1 hypothetical protein [Gemmatimonadota bacterium]NIU72974.1 hypothetical protein [Gammaproteobacteria bacterium]NIX43329.1 hypothetical protein [Gemmatimonadota bacterium]NIY07499.1 hypothetical protein [Gemmatimonadota bacterium]